MTLLAGWSRADGAPERPARRGRRHAVREPATRELEALIGFFVNTLAIACSSMAARPSPTARAGAGARRSTRYATRTCRSSTLFEALQARAQPEPQPDLPGRCSRSDNTPPAGSTCPA
jgi:hypothetical protein